MGSVRLHVYDLAPELNEKLRFLGLGVWHSGVELSGVGELWFYGHDAPGLSGVVAIDHATALRLLPLRATVDLGCPSSQPSSSSRDVVDALTLEYLGPSYHILRRNCNTFCEELAARLGCPRPVPGWVNRIAFMGRLATAVVPEQTLWRLLARFSGGGSGGDDLQQLPSEEEAAAAAAAVAEAPPRPGLTPEAHRNLATEAFLAANAFTLAHAAVVQQQRRQEVTPSLPTPPPPPPIASTAEAVPVPVLVSSSMGKGEEEGGSALAASSTERTRDSF